jgi:ribose transport system permease protein
VAGRGERPATGSCAGIVSATKGTEPWQQLTSPKRESDYRKAGRRGSGRMTIPEDQSAMADTVTADRSAILAPSAPPVHDDAAAIREAQLARRRKLIERVQGQGLLLVLAIVFVIMWIESPYFMSVDNLLTAASVVSILGVMAVVETLVIIAGEIDISIGSVMAVVSVLIGIFVGKGVDPWVASLIALLIAAGIGFANGILVVWFRINSLVVTLGSYSIALGVAYVLSNSSTVSLSGSDFGYLGSGEVWRIPVPLFVFLAVWILAQAMLKLTALGRHIYAVGDNYDAAVRAGVRANWLRIGLFVAMSMSAALAGIIVTSELTSSAPQIGNPYLLSVVTAVILGGASLSGGRGTLLGTLIAVAILGVLQNGFALLALTEYTQYIVLGSLLILAVLTDQLVRRVEP